MKSVFACVHVCVCVRVCEIYLIVTFIEMTANTMGIDKNKREVCAKETKAKRKTTGNSYIL